LVTRPSRPQLFPYTTLFRSDRVLASAETRHWSFQTTTRPGDPDTQRGRSRHPDHWLPNSALFVRSPVRDGLYHLLSQRRGVPARSEEHTSELQSRGHLVCRL